LAVKKGGRGSSILAADLRMIKKERKLHLDLHAESQEYEGAQKRGRRGKNEDLKRKRGGAGCWIFKFS